MASPCHHGGLAAEGCRPGVAIAIMAPVVVPRKRALCRGKGAGSAIRALCGPGWTRLLTCAMGAEEAAFLNAGVLYTFFLSDPPV
jgi:hypothetical protein